MTVAEKFLPPVNPLSSSHSDIWKVDYNATVAKEAAMGWEGLGYIFALNGGLFLFAFIWFQLFAKSTRFSLYNFRSSSILSTRKDTQFSLAMWFKLIWHTPIEGTEVEMELGPEGTFYLLFQVYTGRFLALLSVFAITVLVPLYLSLGGDSMDGRVVSAPKENRILAQNISSSTITSIHLNTSSIFEKPSNRTRWWSFAHATIRSIPNESPYLWIPVFSCYLFTIAFGILFKRLSHLSSIYSTGRSKQLSNYVTGSNVTVALPVTEGRNKKKCLPLLCGDPNAPHLVGMQPSELSARSIFVDRGVPMNLREDRMLFLLNEVFPGYIQDCSVVLNLSEYHTYHNKRIAEEASFEREKMLSEMELNGQKIPFMLRFFPGGMKFPIFSSFCSSGRQIFYQKETTLLQKIKALKESEKESLESIIRQNKGAGRAFIVFHTARYRARFVRRVRNRSIASILARFSDFSKPKCRNIYIFFIV
jgi:hypothetical protein